MDTRELNLKPLSQEDLDELDRLRDSHPRLWQYIRELVQAVSVLASELQALLSERDALRAENERLRDALREYQSAAKSWHECHDHEGNGCVQCDLFCEIMERVDAAGLLVESTQPAPDQKGKL
jgi:FtsZ-binding cell division protein ZapB